MYVHVLVQVDRPLSIQSSEVTSAPRVRSQVFARCLVWCAGTGLHECATSALNCSVVSPAPSPETPLFIFLNMPFNDHCYHCSLQQQ